MMSTLERLCHESIELVREIEAQLMQYENVGDDFVMNLESDITESKRKLQANFERMDIFVDKEPFSRRQTSKLRVDQIRYDFQHLEAAFKGLQGRRAQRLQERRQREELLATDFTKTSTNGYTAIRMDGDLGHHSRLKNVNSHMDNLLDHGQEILGSLRSQRHSLKNIKTRVLDIASKLGLSTTVMRMIERRGVQDKYLLYGGMIITLCLMLAVYWYFT